MNGGGHLGLALRLELWHTLGVATGFGAAAGLALEPKRLRLLVYSFRGHDRRIGEHYQCSRSIALKETSRECTDDMVDWTIHCENTSARHELIKGTV
jgi:hypothetical protein